jgi:ribosomal protein S18 acetylase RimI-like enzyme
MITKRPFFSATDLIRITDLTHEVPGPRLLDLPYRLASWSLDDPENVGLWEDASGQLVGFGVLQLPWLALDYVVRPDVRDSLEPEILEWGKLRGQALAAKQGSTSRVNVWLREDQPEQKALAQAHGFQFDGDVMLHLTRPLSDLLPSPQLTEGFQVRPLRGQPEVAAYVALHQTAFGTKNMTVEWRSRTLHMPHYVPETDIVIAAPDDQIVAFCICWLHGEQGQVEPLGTHPDYERRGFGRSMLLEVFRRMQARGLVTAHVDCYEENDPARALYESVGFRKQYRMLAYAHDFEPPTKS